MKEKMIAEYRTWFKIYHKFLKQIKVDESIKAEYAEEYRHKLEGMLTLMFGMRVITEEKYETMCKEVEEEFNPEKLYGFRYIRRTEVFYADRD